MIQQFHYWVFIQRKKKTLNTKNKCIPLLIAALFIIAKIWKQTKQPSIDEWIKKMWYTYTIEYSSAIKKRMKICHFQHTDEP